ncbi:MAG: AAA family ATPase, partial [Lawsonibacter sp.]|nr:AAA family ATPase [Lawsonibacter sp.]
MPKEYDILRTSTIPVIALRGLTVFPSVLIHFEVAREASVKALEAAMTAGSPVFLVGQKDIAVEEPGRDDLYQVGTISSIRQILRMPGDNVRVMVEGQTRGRMLQLLRVDPYLEAEVEEIAVPEVPARSGARTEALMRSTYELFQDYAELSPKLAPDLMVHVLASQDPGHIADYIAQNIPMRNSDKQAILEEIRPVKRLEKLHRLLEREVEILSLDHEIQERARQQMSENQRDYYLREQIKAIQAELGEDGDEIEEYRQKIAQAKLPEVVREKLNRELGRLAKQSYSSSESTVLRSYLDVCLELPWGKKTKEKINVAAVRKALDQDHFGLDKVKQRILEFVAVKQLSPELKGQIICLAGPPGVGKTSIAMSMAKAMNRKLVRISLGGVSDEAEIRGHRKTYVGAMPGRIINAINQAQSCNPLILLDEIDKLGRDHRGDPSSALLEVLDGEQNSTFRDNFLEVPFDLSDVLFVTTANTTDTIPRPLLDRMEVIELSSYTDEEKVQIAKKHLLPKELKRHGLTKAQLKVSDGA